MLREHENTICSAKGNLGNAGVNPTFELDQIHRYIDHLQGDPRQLANTAESHFFPVLQRIFLREGFEVRHGHRLLDHDYAFLLVDLDRRRNDIIVDFRFSVEGTGSMIPGSVLSALEVTDGDVKPPAFLVLRNRPLSAGSSSAYGEFGARLRFLDFEGLKRHASETFAIAEEHETHRALTIVREMIEQLIAAVAAEDINIVDIEWRDIERLFHQTLQGLGFHAHLTPPGNDGGRDILACEILVDDVHWFNVEIKHWRGRAIGKREASATLETAIYEGRRGALLLAPRPPGNAALSVRSELHQDYLRFGAEAKIVKSCCHYVSRDGKIWMQPGGLRSFLFDSTH